MSFILLRVVPQTSSQLRLGPGFAIQSGSILARSGAAALCNQGDLPAAERQQEITYDLMVMMPVLISDSFPLILRVNSRCLEAWGLLGNLYILFNAVDVYGLSNSSDLLHCIMCVALYLMGIHLRFLKSAWFIANLIVAGALQEQNPQVSANWADFVQILCYLAFVFVENN